MDLEDTNYIKDVHIVDVDGEPMDVIELNDGRVIAIDGERLRLFDDLQSLIDLDAEDEDVDQPMILL